MTSRQRASATSSSRRLDDRRPQAVPRPHRNGRVQRGHPKVLAETGVVRLIETELTVSSPRSPQARPRNSRRSSYLPRRQSKQQATRTRTQRQRHSQHTPGRERRRPRPRGLLHAEGNGTVHHHRRKRTRSYSGLRAKLVDEARELEKASDSVLRTPHAADGKVLHKSTLVSKPE